MRDCENCKHYVEKVEVGKGSSPEHYFGCDSWECEFKPTTKNDLGVDLISREQALVAIRNLYPGMPRVDFSGSLRKWVDKYKPYIECDDAIKQLPSVTPQLSSGLEKNSKKLEKNFGELDCISRKAILDELEKWDWQELYLPIHFKQMLDELPTVTPQEPKTGHWIEVTNGRGGHECDVCHDYAPSFQNGNEYLSAFCPNCGAKMVEPQESEET